MQLRRTGLRVALAATGVLLTGLLIAGVFFRFEVGPPWRVVPRFEISGWLAALPSHLPWVIPMFILAAALPPLRAWLWGTTLRQPAPAYGERFVAIALGALVNNTVPGRVGLLGSAYVLGKRTSRPVSEVLASLLLAKLLEFAAIVSVTATLLAAAHGLGWAPAGFGRPVAAGAIALVIFVAVFAMVARRRPDVTTDGLSVRFPRVATAIARLRTGLEAVESGRRLAAGYAIGLVLAATAALGYGLALRHADVTAGILGGGLVLGALTLGQLTPGLPVGPGIHYAVVAWAVRALGVTAGEAAALAALSHAATVVAHLSVGGVTAFAQRRHLRALIPRRQ